MYCFLVAALSRLQKVKCPQGINSKLWGPITQEECAIIRAFALSTMLRGAAFWTVICETHLPYRLPGMLQSLWDCQICWQGALHGH